MRDLLDITFERILIVCMRPQLDVIMRRIVMHMDEHA